MDKPTRLPLTQGADIDGSVRGERGASPGNRASPLPVKPISEPPASRAKKDARFVGGAMKALFESSDVSIRRGDETRVMSRAQEALATLQEKHPDLARSLAGKEGSAKPSSLPPGPRVDAVLWIVLALGLFAIVGWMLAYGL